MGGIYKEVYQYTYRLLGLLRPDVFSMKQDGSLNRAELETNFVY